MKSKIPLIMAFVVGIVALLAIRSYVKKMEQATKDQLSGDMVVMARVNIPKGTELTAEMLGGKEVPRQFMPRQALPYTRQQLQTLKGQKVAVNFQVGDIILSHDLASEEAGGLSSVIKPDLRAYTVSIKRGIQPGLIVPGDRIDIMGSFASPKPNQPVAPTVSSWRQGSDMVNVVVLQDVQVIAIGDNYSTTSGLEKGGSDLTLELTLPEAQLLMFASEHGELGAVLRNEKSTDIKSRDQLKRVTFEDVEQIIGDVDGQRAKRLVEVLNGSKLEAFPVNSTSLNGGH